MSTDAAKAVVRRNTDEVQSGGNFEVFEELFADDFVDHTPQRTPRPTRWAYVSSTAMSVPLSLTFMLRSTGNSPTVIA
jgi:hypothetical protein